MTKTILFTRPFDLFSGCNETPVRKALANFMQAEMGFMPVFERPHERLCWADFDAVAPYAGRSLPIDGYAEHYLQQLEQSMATQQRRWMHWDDPYFTPLSTLKLADRADKGEYTDVLMLDLNMPVYDDFVKYRKYWSESIYYAEVHICPMWTYPVDLSGLAIADVTKLKHQALYAGYPKPDRLALVKQFPSITFGKFSYAEYIAEASLSLANVMMNSPTHLGAATPRYYESAALSIQLWPASVYVVGHTPRPDRVFASDAELLAILAELAKQTPQQRSAELCEQLATVHATMQYQLATYRTQAW